MPAAGRHDRLDALRGAAMLWMAGFHLGVDLDRAGLIPRQDFLGNPAWWLQRVAIVGLFLATAGIGQAIAERAGQSPRRFWRRWMQVAGCALLVSLGSLWLFPATWIHFGVLHGIALMLLVLRAARPLRAGLWVLGLVALLLPSLVQAPVFDHRATDWIGLYTRDPPTEDHVPLLPWLAVMAWGLAAGRLLLDRWPHWLAGPLAAPLRPLAALGRWPLTFYMLHQPVLVGLVALVA